MPVIRYQIKGIAHCRTQAMVHFKQFLELMEGSDIDYTYDVEVQFCHNDGRNDAHVREVYSCPDSIIPLFVSADIGDYAGFSMLHGVSKHGAMWDSEGQGSDL